MNERLFAWTGSCAWRSSCFLQCVAGVGAKPDAPLKIVPDVKAIAGETVLRVYKAEFVFYSQFALCFLWTSLDICWGFMRFMLTQSLAEEGLFDARKVRAFRPAGVFHTQAKLPRSQLQRTATQRDARLQQRRKKFRTLRRQ